MYEWACVCVCIRIYAYTHMFVCVYKSKLIFCKPRTKPPLNLCQVSDIKRKLFFFSNYRNKGLKLIPAGSYHIATSKSINPGRKKKSPWFKCIFPFIGNKCMSRWHRVLCGRQRSQAPTGHALPPALPRPCAALCSHCSRLWGMYGIKKTHARALSQTLCSWLFLFLRLRGGWGSKAFTVRERTTRDTKWCF